MYFDKTCTIELAVSKDPLREHLSHVHLDKEERALVATNGHWMARIPAAVEDEDSSGPVPVEALKMARKLTKRKEPMTSPMTANGSVSLHNGTVFERPNVAPFPPWRDLEKTTYEGKEGTTTFAINAEYLWKAAQAIGAKNGAVRVTVHHGDEILPIRVEPLDRSEGYTAIVMPLRK